MINVIIADHQPIYRTGIAKLLAAEDDMRIIAQPLSTDHLLNAVERLRPTVVILSSGFLAASADIHKVAKSAGERRVAILMLAENTEKSPQFIPLGAQGVFYRSVKSTMLIEGVRRLARGGRYLQMHAADEICPDLIGERVTSKLSRRELKIIAAVVQGFKNREIAEQLGTTEQMVKKSVRMIYDKTGVSGRFELALFVIHHQVLAQAAAAEHPIRSWAPASASDSARDGRAVEAIFYPIPKSGLPAQSCQNQLTPPRNHSWYHRVLPDCGK